MRKAVLIGADFSKADLEGADLRGADLLGVNLAGANLKGVKLEGAKNVPLSLKLKARIGLTKKFYGVNQTPLFKGGFLFGGRGNRSRLWKK